METMKEQRHFSATTLWLVTKWNQVNEIFRKRTTNISNENVLRRSPIDIGEALQEML
jgi:hypothetical protein